MNSDNEIYTRYRKGLIQRHIANNGRLLEGIWLAEEGSGFSTPQWNTIKRNSIERLSDNSLYQYNAFPLLLPDEFYNLPRQFYLAGGGDNPLLMGGLAIAIFAIETLLGISSQQSLIQAERLIKFTYNSQVYGQSGFFTRKRHFYSQSNQFSIDEICGMLIGLLFLNRAALEKNNTRLKEYVDAITTHLARFLKENKYMIIAPMIPGRGNPKAVKGQFAFIWQYPFGRVFKEITGDSWQSGTTIPEKFDDEIGIEVSELVTFMKALTLDFNYTPQELFKDIVGFYGGALNLSEKNLFNVTMMLYCILMIIESKATDEKTRFKNAKLANDVLKAISYDNGPFDGARKPFRHNLLCAIIAKRCANICKDEDPGWNNALDEKISRLQEGEKLWFSDLPLGTPSNQNLQPFKVTNAQGNYYSGSWYAWTANSTHGISSFMNIPAWDLGESVNHIGPFAPRVASVTESDLSQFYSVDFSKSLRIEASGIDFLFARMLASYFGFINPPSLTDGDPGYTSLPADGPLSDGFLANNATGEVHDLSSRTKRCYINKLLRITQKQDLPTKAGLKSPAFGGHVQLSV